MADDPNAELKTRSEDLASFWDMTMIQVCSLHSTKKKMAKGNDTLILIDIGFSNVANKFRFGL